VLFDRLSEKVGTASEVELEEGRVEWWIGRSWRIEKE